MSSHQEIYEEFKERFAEESSIRTRGRPYRQTFGLHHYPQYVGAVDSLWRERENMRPPDIVFVDRQGRSCLDRIRELTAHRTPGPFWWAP